MSRQYPCWKCAANHISAAHAGKRFRRESHTNASYRSASIMLLRMPHRGRAERRAGLARRASPDAALFARWAPRRNASLRDITD